MDAVWVEPVPRDAAGGAAADALVERLRWQLGPGAVFVPAAPRADGVRCLVHVDGTAMAARVVRLLTEASVPPVFVTGAPGASPDEAPPEAAPGAVYVAVERMNALLGLDAESGVAHVQAGCTWERVEWLLRRRGLTLGPVPAWLLGRTVLETFATNDRLRPSPRYGQLVDAPVALAAVLPRGHVARSSVAPRRSTGPDLGRLLLGTRHRDGLLTEVHLQAWPLPEARAWRAVELPDWAAAVAAATTLLRAGVRPAWWRLDRPDARGPVRLWAALVGTAGVEGPAARFDAVLGARAVGAAEVEAAAEALFPLPAPDPRRDAAPRPFGTVAWAPLPALAAAAAAIEGAEVWDVGPEGGTVYARSAVDDLQVQRLRDLGAWLDAEGAPAGDEGWNDLAAAVAARLAAGRGQPQSDRPGRAGSPS